MKLRGRVAAAAALLAAAARGGRLLRSERPAWAARGEEGAGADSLGLVAQAHSFGAGRAAAGGSAAGAGAGAGAGADRSALEEQLDALAARLLAGDKASVHNVTLSASKRLSFRDAAARLQGRLPVQVAALVRLAENASVSSTGSRARRGSEFSEESLAKALAILNGMVETAMADLDQVIIESSEFKEKNRGTFGQVSNDIKRIAGQISDLRRKQTGAQGNIAEQTRMRDEASSEMEKSKLECSQAYEEKSADLKLKEADLDVFNFVLEATRCADEEAASFEQDGATPGSLQKHRAGHPRSNESAAKRKATMMICATPRDGFQIHFDDPAAQAKFQRLLTTPARQVLERLVGKVAQKEGLLEVRAGRSQGEAIAHFNTTTTAPLLEMVEPTPVQTAPSEGQWKKCTNGVPSCGLLHDSMSVQWGVYRDLVDELKYEMSVDKAECQAMQDNLNEQLAVIASAKTKAMEMLAETVSSVQAASQESTEKNEEYRELEEIFEKQMGEYKSKVDEILFTNICAVRKVRDGLMMNSEVSPPEKIEDCDVEDWSPGECSVACDDECPSPDPSACGGWQTLERRVLTQPNEFGIKCPVLTMQKKCNQIRCPVDCGMSEWSAWSACAADCGGGVQGRTRSILVKPKNGGQECDTAMESQPCNTGSCDRDCVLAEWTPWSPCSVACGGGFQERARKVAVPIRGMGKCPVEDHADRLEEQPCNAHECIGDEVCIAKQDLVIAIDGSGSMREGGFETLRDFAANVSQRYKPMYYGAEAMRVGVILFGQGSVEDDGTVTPAEMVQELTNDTAAVKEQIESLAWQRGTTNLAQALSLADRMFREGGRPDAQSAIMILTDGRPSLRFASGQAVRKLKDKNVKVFMAPIADNSGKDTDLLKQWASQPWETNYERIPGLAALKPNFDMFGQRLVAKFCPSSFSPSRQKQKEEARGFILLHELGCPDEACAPGISSASSSLGTFASQDACSAEAAARGVSIFCYYARGRLAGACFGGSLEVSAEQWEEWKANSVDPKCPNGEWTPDPYADTYAVSPDLIALHHIQPGYYDE